MTNSPHKREESRRFDLKMNPKKENNLITTLKQKIIRYQRANKEYWDSIYDLEQYTTQKIGNGKNNATTEVIDDTIQLQVSTITDEIKQLTNYLTKESIPFELEEENNIFHLTIGIYDMVWDEKREYATFQK